MDKDTRNAIERATQRARKLLEDDFASQLEGTYDILRSGAVATTGGTHLSARQQVLREKIVASIEHKRAAGMKRPEAVMDSIRDAAFTALNRFVALKMLEARELVQECISKGEQSSGYKEFCGLAPGVGLLADGAGYRLYVESLFDELSTEIKALFDRRDPASVLWPKRQTFGALLALLNVSELASVWGEDETIGWVYQYFNSSEERRAVREASQAPRNSRELAIRNQFFTPRYVVHFLTDNTLGRIWYEMQQGETQLVEICEYLVRRPDETCPPRAKKDPRDIRVLDPACGSGHFLLYAFDLLLVIYEEAWNDPQSPKSATTGRTVRDDYSDLNALRRALPALVLRYNLHGVDIDPRCAQIAELALWMRAQRAFRDFRIVRGDRPLIRRANVVIAEPIPGNGALVETFAATLDPPLLGELFGKIVAEVKLAGELGLLLKIEVALAHAVTKAREEFVAREKELAQACLSGFEPVRQQGDLNFSGIDDQRFFEEAETRIVEALQRFVGSATGSTGMRRRLFAEDAAQGLGLVELAEKKFDVLLMNPPFGDATPEATAYLEAHYNNTRLDLFASFCERLLSLAEPDGLVGAITPRDGFFKKTLIGWRELVLAHHMSVVADLGIGVLDSATVRVAAYVIASAQSETATRFIDLVDLPERELRLLNKACTPQRVFGVPMRSFRVLPLVRFLYWLPARLWEIYASAEPLENRACTPRYGLTTLSDERFCRLFVEVDPALIGSSGAWAFMSKGGDDFPYGGVSNCVVRWQDDAAEMAQVNRQSNGQIAQTRRASKYYFRPAVAFSNRSVQFSVRWHPANFVFSVRGPAVIPLRASQAYLLGFFNSRLIRAVIQMQTASQTYTSGVLKELQWVEPNRETRETVARAARDAFAQVRIRLATVETDPFFDGLVARAAGGPPTTVTGYLEWRRRFVDELNERLQTIQSTIDQEIARLYGVSVADIERCERAEEPSENVRGFPPQFDFALSGAEALASYLFGLAIGRWTARVVESAPGLDSSAPRAQPGASGRSDVLPIAVDDEGHHHDIVSMVRAAVGDVLKDATEEDVATLEDALGNDLREWFSRTFFSSHIATHSGFGRRSPVYWQLAIPSGRYSVWIYLHAFTKDTLYQVQNDYVAPKLAHEERRLTSMRKEYGDRPKAGDRKQLAAQETLAEELRQFLDEVRRLAPLWNPNLDDGVILSFAPLWRLVPHHKSWQKDLKAMWHALCAGEYDWSHLAMHLWPERVIPKCATDRSLAIAHGLEDVFWAEGADGKWKPRPEPKCPIEEVVRERTSPAVKAALKSLLEAPAIAAAGRRRPNLTAPRG